MLALLGTVAPARAQSVPGHTVTTFSTPPFPQLLAFDAAGILYAGRDDSPGGSADPTFVTRITSSGSTSSYGLAPIPDPDALVVDITGAVSGVRGAVLVGGLVTLSGPGRVSAIAPNGSVSTLFESASYGNISELKIDASGRLLFVSVDQNMAFSSESGATPTALFATGVSPVFLAVAPDGRIYTSDASGTIRVNESNGALVTASFAQFSGRVSIEFAQGGGFGHDLLAFESNTGTLFRVDASGAKTVIGTGFDACDDLAIGPCGAVSLSCRLQGKILRISSEPSPDIDGNGQVDGADLAQILGAWGDESCAADLNQDGTVDGADLAMVLGNWGPV